MSETTILWIIGGLVGALIALVGVIWKTLNDQVAAVSKAILDYERKLNPSERLVLREKVKYLEQDRRSIHEWRRDYLPREMARNHKEALSYADRGDKDLIRRIELLERRVFNGRDHNQEH